jgi:hypothetical protein
LLFEDEGRVLDQILEATEKDGAAAVVDEILDLRSIEARGEEHIRDACYGGLARAEYTPPAPEIRPRAPEIGMASSEISRAQGRALWKMSAAHGAAHGVCVSSHGFHF